MTQSRSARLFASAAGLAAAAVLYAQCVWQPIASARAAAATTLAQAKAEAAPAPRVDPAAAITAAAARARLTIRSIGARDAGTRVVIEDARFDHTLEWLARLDRDAGLRVATITIGRRAQPGRVTVDVTLTRS